MDDSIHNFRLFDGYFVHIVGVHVGKEEIQREEAGSFDRRRGNRGVGAGKVKGNKRVVAGKSGGVELIIYLRIL